MGQLCTRLPVLCLDTWHIHIDFVVALRYSNVLVFRPSRPPPPLLWQRLEPSDGLHRQISQRWVGGEVGASLDRPLSLSVYCESISKIKSCSVIETYITLQPSRRIYLEITFSITRSSAGCSHKFDTWNLTMISLVQLWVFLFCCRGSAICLISAPSVPYTVEWRSVSPHEEPSDSYHGNKAQQQWLCRSLKSFIFSIFLSKTDFIQNLLTDMNFYFWFNNLQ